MLVDLPLYIATYLWLLLNVYWVFCYNNPTFLASSRNFTQTKKGIGNSGRDREREHFSLTCKFRYVCIFTLTLAYATIRAVVDACSVRSAHVLVLQQNAIDTEVEISKGTLETATLSKYYVRRRWEEMDNGSFVLVSVYRSYYNVVQVCH